MAYYPNMLKKIKITPEFKELLYKVELESDLLKIEGLFFYNIIDYKSTSPLYIYNPITDAYSRLKYNGCPLFYLVGSDYLVYNPTTKNAAIRLTTFNQSRATEIDHKYIVEDKEVEDHIPVYTEYFEKPVSKRWLATKIMSFLMKFGYDNASYELTSNKLIIKFNDKPDNKYLQPPTL